MTTALIPDTAPLVLEDAAGDELIIEIVRQGDPAPEEASPAAAALEQEST